MRLNLTLAMLAGVIISSFYASVLFTLLTKVHLP